jgi:hypothetical protein
VHLDDVIDALRLADADVVAAWIRERGQRFDVTQRDLAQLDLAGVPPRVTEALTAIADSTAALARAADSSSYAESYAMAQQTSGSSFDDDFVPFSYWGVGFYSPFSSRRGGRPGVPGHGGGTPPGSQGGTVRLGKPHP